MPRFGRIMIAATLPLAVGAQALVAQVAGIPVYYNPRGGAGISVAANLGFQSSDAGDAKAVAVGGGIGAGPAYFTATVGQINPDSAGLDNEMTYGGTVSFKVFGGGLLPVSVAAQAGVGVVKFGNSTRTNVPVGVAVGLNLPLFPLKPWIAPRVAFQSATNVPTGVGTATKTETETRFGVTAGADFNLLLGLGLHAAVDFQPKKGTNPSATVVGVGAHFNFRVPMM